MMALADALHARGHQVHVSTLAAEVERVRKSGVEASPISDEVEAVPMDDYLGKNPLDALKRGIRAFLARAPHESRDLKKAVSSFRPDALVVDCNAYGAQVYAEASGLPWCTFQPYFSPLPSSDVPPFGPGLRRSSGPFGRLRDALMRPMITGQFAKLFLPGLNALRTEAGLESCKDLRALFTRAPRTLYLTAESFDYPRTDWPESYVFVGPLSLKHDAPPPEWLEQDLRPVVLVTCSTETQADRAIVDAALEGLTDTDYLVVATTAAHDPETFAKPRNARVQRFVPHEAVLRRAAVVVCHGGMGITQKALAYGVPLCVVPFGRDQLEVARRVEAAGAGVRLMPRRLGAISLKDAVKAAECLRPWAERLASDFSKTGGAKFAADVIESLIPAAQTQPGTSVSDELCSAV